MRCTVQVALGSSGYVSTHCYEKLDDNGCCSQHGQQIYIKPEWMNDDQWKASWQRLGYKVSDVPGQAPIKL